MRVYISGPMTGYPDHNFPAFHQAAKRLRGRGFLVENPAEHFQGETGLPYTTYMRKDVESIVYSDMIVTLPNWRQSPGAMFEVYVGSMIGVPQMELEDFLEKSIISRLQP